MRAIGIDPGTIVTGFGVVEEEDARLFHTASGTISVSQKLPIAQRLHHIHGRLEEIIKEWRPHALVLEGSFYGKNVQTILRLGQVNGVIQLAAESAGIPVFEYAPMAVKLSVVGYGAAKKEQVHQMVGRLLKMEKSPDSHHASDALATAICHLHSYKMNEIAGMR